jgi:hypothetical protein
MREKVLTDATSIYFSLVYERHAASHPWLDWEWKVSGLMPVADADIHRPARLLERGNLLTRWLGEPSRIDLHRTDVEAYIYNLTSPQPSIYSVSREREESVAEGLTWEPHLITLSSYEVEEYQSGDDYLIGKQALPADVQEWLEAFVALHYKDEPFRKRQRVRHDNEQHLFGQESLVELRARLLAEGKSDGEKH